jgi:hypothetical protein
MSHPFQRSRYIPSQCGFCGHPENDAVHSGFTPAEIATARHEELMQAFGKILSAVNAKNDLLMHTWHEQQETNARLADIGKRLDGIEPKQDALLGQGTALSTMLSNMWNDIKEADAVHYERYDALFDAKQKPLRPAKPRSKKRKGEKRG